ncbi:MAG: hypothetical protein FWH03_06615 [Firmicutes bacterium]|nr:hypothetical protein [Bacillota bacterium]
MPVFFAVVITVLLLLTRDIRIEASVEVNALSGGGAFTLRVFGIRLYKGKFTFNPTDSPAKKRRAKPSKRAKISFSAVTALLSNLRIKKAEISVCVGTAHDPFLTTIAFASARILIYTLTGFLKTHFFAQNVRENLLPAYNADRLDAQAYVKAYLSIADILYGVCLLLLKRFTHKTISRRKPHEHNRPATTR